MKLNIEYTANPNIIKFVSTNTLIEGSAEFTKESQNIPFPIFNKILTFPFVNKILITANFVAIEKLDFVQWSAISAELQEILEDELPTQLSLKIQKIPVSIYAEMTPNPNVMKFVANTMLHDGIIEVKSVGKSNEVPLAKELYNFPFVKEIFITENYISITKNNQDKWEDHIMEMREFIWNYLTNAKPIISDHYKAENSEQTMGLMQSLKPSTETEKEILKILEEYVKPAVANDGGNIDLIEFDEDTKTAKMLLQGACSGCPSSTLTLKNGIETMLHQMLPGKVASVIAVNG